MASLILKQIERGTISFAAADFTKTVTLTTPLTDIAKTILLSSVKCNSNISSNQMILCQILSTTQIQFERHNTPPTVAADVEYQVIEFTQGITVQHMVIQQSTATVNTTIMAVDLAKTFVIATDKNIGNSYGPDDSVRYDLTTTTNIASIVTVSSVSNYSAIQVVQIDDASVQKINTTAWTTGGTLDITVTTIDPAKTFWTFGFSDNNTVNCDQWPYLSYVNSTTLRFTKNFAGSYGSKDITTYVVSLPYGVKVQNISTVIASGASSVSPAITSAVVANTALMINGINQRLASTGEADDNAGGGELALSGLTSTAFTATRAASPAYAATTNVQVLEFMPATVNNGTLVGDNALVNDSTLIGILNLID